MAMWKNDDEMFALMKEKLYTPVVGDILDQMGYKHQFLPASIRPLAMSTFLTAIEPLFQSAVQVNEIEGIILNPWNRTIMLDKTLLRLILGESGK